MDCEWNYRSDNCEFSDNCEAKDGVKLMHGNREVFHKNFHPNATVFRTFYKVMRQVCIETRKSV